MLIEKREHKANVAVCWNFTAGNCELGDDICLFNHSKQSKTSEKTELSKCNTCGEVFKTLNDLKHNKKRDHVLTVPPCKNAIKGSFCLAPHTVAAAARVT